MKRIIWFGICAACAMVVSIGAANADVNTPVKANNVLLVHGAWADGSSWSKIIPILQQAGLHVTAVQNPLTSLEASAAETRRVLSQQDGPTVLVGHSFGGTIISEAGNDPKVSALVYVAARAPDTGEDFTALSKKFPKTFVRTGAVEDNGLLTIGEDSFLKYFANGLPEAEAKTLFAVQQPTAKAALVAKTTAAAWHDKPTFYAVSNHDMTISPELERFLANRMKAKTIEVDAGHLPMISQPEAIADLILSATGHKK